MSKIKLFIIDHNGNKKEGETKIYSTYKGEVASFKITADVENAEITNILNNILNKSNVEHNLTKIRFFVTYDIPEDNNDDYYELFKTYEINISKSNELTFLGVPPQFDLAEALHFICDKLPCTTLNIEDLN